MPLTDPKIRNAKPKEKAYRIYDEKGLYLEVSPRGGKWWRLKYRIAGKEKRLSLGTYPDTTLKQARDERDKARIKIREGIDPSSERRATKANPILKHQNTFEAIGREWLERN